MSVDIEHTEEEIRQWKVEQKEVDDLYNSFWKEILLDDGSGPDLELLKKELYDFHNLIDNVCKVYCHITGGRMSNPRYYAEDVIALADDVTNNTVNENCKEFMVLLSNVVNSF